MPHSAPLLRLVVCVDGRKSPRHGSGQFSTTNVSRIASLVKEGTCERQDGSLIRQILVFGHVGDEGPDTSPVKTSQVESLTRTICQLLNSSQDEVFFFGSGHGAYIVRAVAGVLHHMGLPKAWSMVRFHENYLNALELYKAKCKEDSVRGPKIESNLKALCDDPPVIKFIGVFDTLAEKKDVGTHDLHFNPSTRTFRHAIALNEISADLVEVPFYGDMKGRSLVQAWFIGSNDEICGTLLDDDLSRYPLQWMILESVDAGLRLEERSIAGLEESPLTIAFPPLIFDDNQPIEWRAKYKNGITVRTFNLQANYASSSINSNGSNESRLKRSGSISFRSRKIFNAKGLVGWSDKGPSSTLIHPSVYILLDKYPRLRAKHRVKGIAKELADFRARYMEDSDKVAQP